MWQPLLKKLEWKHKNNKFLYYSTSLARELVPGVFLRSRRNKKIAEVESLDLARVKERVNYYNKLSTAFTLSDTAVSLSDFTISKYKKVYYFDTYQYTRYFDPQFRIHLIFGDTIHVPPEPTIVKSRPIHGENQCSVLLKLNKVRHFTFTNDTKKFESKKNMLVGRAVVNRGHRIRFYERYFNHPMCDIGQINRNKNPQWIKGKLTIDEHLDYKFVLCIEGNDVASNLKWVMSSNSLAVMPKPKYETWFMEGTLIPNHHYVLIKDDYSDLEERLQYYINHTEEALQIIKNANDYITQFKNKKQEDLISLMVLEKYFHRTGQLSTQNSSLFNQSNL